MIRTCKALTGHRLAALDGEIGKVHDFYFDDQGWAVRYLVADTGYWLPGRLVLVSPFALKGFDDREQRLNVALTRDQIENSPPITADEPVSRRFERQYYQYYGWPAYWAGPALWGPGPYPLYYAPEEPRDRLDANVPEGTNDYHLRSMREVTGYGIHAMDGDIGHVSDFLLDDADWAVRYLVVATGHWLSGKNVLIAPGWITGVFWDRSAVSVDLTRAAIQDAPPYDDKHELKREYERQLYEHYSRPGYWSQTERRAA